MIVNTHIAARYCHSNACAQLISPYLPLTQRPVSQVSEYQQRRTVKKVKQQQQQRKPKEAKSCFSEQDFARFEREYFVGPRRR